MGLTGLYINTEAEHTGLVVVVQWKELPTWDKDTTELSSFIASSTTSLFGLDFVLRIAVATSSLLKARKYKRTKIKYVSTSYAEKFPATFWQ